MSNVSRIKLDDVKPGDKLVADNGFTCLEGGVHTVYEVEGRDGMPYYALKCASGWHDLAGQEGDDGYLVGLTRAPGTVGHA
ncbi:MAG TPA: hypothetical protein VM659_28755 [Dongiaceae bacterium]|nr:hypothetical protein [Dongiaceae bacterium]